MGTHLKSNKEIWKRRGCCFLSPRGVRAGPSRVDEPQPEEGEPCWRLGSQQCCWWWGAAAAPRTAINMIHETACVPRFLSVTHLSAALPSVYVSRAGGPQLPPPLCL